MQSTLPPPARRVALPALPEATTDRLWREFWRPYWAWSDAPPPELSTPEVRFPAHLGLAGEAVVSGIDRIRRNLWISHAAVFIDAVR